MEPQTCPNQNFFRTKVIGVEIGIALWKRDFLLRAKIGDFRRGTYLISLAKELSILGGCEVLGLALDILRLFHLLEGFDVKDSHPRKGGTTVNLF